LDLSRTRPGIDRRYLDSLGTLLGAVNGVLLRQRQPTTVQIAFWDRWLLPISKLIDQVMSSVMGRSVVAVWQRG
jgi:hypothetical protein